MPKIKKVKKVKVIKKSKNLKTKVKPALRIPDKKISTGADEKPEIKKNGCCLIKSFLQYGLIFQKRKIP